MPAPLAPEAEPAASRIAAPRRPRRWVYAGTTILALILALSIVVPLVSPYGTDEFVGAPLEEPSGSHLFGTDSFGRDVFVRTFAAARIDLLVAIVGVIVPLICGTVVGVASAAAERRWVDAVVMRIVDAILAFPFVILILALVVIFGPKAELGPLPPGLPALFAGLFLVAWTVYARLARAQTLSLREREFVVAARLLGYSKRRIVLRHLAPNVLATTATYAVSDAMLVIVLTASLPFLGAGVQPPTPEWGAIMYEGRSVIATAPWVSLAPGVLLALTGLGISMVAGGLLPKRRAA